MTFSGYPEQYTNELDSECLQSSSENRINEEHFQEAEPEYPAFSYTVQIPPTCAVAPVKRPMEDDVEDKSPIKKKKRIQKKDTANESVGYVLNDERRIVLIGKTGAGKSATGNTILERDAFESRTSSGSVTSKCQIATAPEKKIFLVDTPGIFDTNRKEDELISRIGECVVLCPEGFHAIVVILSLGSGGRYTDDEKEAIHTIKGIFGEGAEKHMIVLFTAKDQLKDISIQDYIKGSNDLTELMNKCGDRYCAFNNMVTGAERQQQVSELLVMIDKMVDENGGGCYTSEMFEVAKELQQKIENLRSSNADENPQEQNWDIFGKFHTILNSFESVQSRASAIVGAAAQQLNIHSSQATTKFNGFWQKVKQFFQLVLKLLGAYCPLKMSDRSTRILVS